MEKIKVVYITGWWRSGATILSRSLGSSKDAVFAGELKDYWRIRFMKHNICSCGERFPTCSFWQDVSKEHIRSFPSINFEELKNEFREIEKWSNYYKLRKLIINKKENSLRPILDKYIEQNIKLYEIISQKSGGKIIIDSSRNPGRLLALLSSDKIDMYTIDIIRDPRASMNSLIQKDIRNVHENRQNTLINMLNWDVKNLLGLDIMRKIDADKGSYISYKNFTRHPARVLEQLKQRLNLSLDYEDTNGKFTINLEAGHIFSGNRSRFNTGKITISEDTNWERQLSWFHKTLITIGSLPLHKYLVKKYSLE